MKLLLIGHSIIDHFEEKGRFFTMPGGIFYSVTGILELKNNLDQIYLLTGWNEKSFHLFQKKYDYVDLTYSEEIIEMPEVVLVVNENDREETYKNLSCNLNINKIDSWNIFDGILINMITGYDLTLEQMNVIRTKYNGLIYLDLHTLSRGVNSGLERVYRPVPNVKDWLKCIDVLQVNQFELNTIFDDTNEIDKINKILHYGPKIILVTKGKRGATAYYEENENLVTINLPAESVTVRNTIGCGDIFGSVFFYSYLRSKNVLDSLKLANNYAALFASKEEIIG